MLRSIFRYLDNRFQASANLWAAFPGGFHAGRAEPGTPRPYLTANLIGRTLANTTENLSSEPTLIQFGAVADDLPTAETACQVLMSEFDRLANDPIDGSDSVVTTQRTGGAAVFDEGPNPNAGECWLVTTDYLFLVSRNG